MEQKISSQRIEQNFIDEVISRIDIVNIINEYIPLKKQGNNYSANCPFHKENTPSFTVNSQKQFFYCFGCKESGNALTFVMKYENIGFIEALEKLANTAGMTIPKASNYNQNQSNTSKFLDITEMSCSFYEAQLRNIKGKKSIEYLKNRNITGITAKLFRLGYAPSGWRNLLNFLMEKKYSLKHIEQTGLVKIQSHQKKYDIFRDRIIFPIRNHRGQIVGFGGRTFEAHTNKHSNYNDPKYLNSPETQLFHKSKILYGLYEALQTNKNIEKFIIVEGYLDVIQLHQNGFNNALATLGTATSIDHIHLLSRYTNNFIFCFDGDLAGKAAAKKAMFACMSIIKDEMDIKFVFLPSGEDPDSILTNNGPNAFNEVLEKAIPIDQLFFEIMSENLNLTETSHKTRLITTCIPFLSKIPGPAITHLMFENLSKLVHVSINELKSFMSKPLQKEKPVKKETESDDRSVIRLLSALLLQNPQLINDITDQDFDSISQYPNSKFPLDLIEIIKKNPNTHTGGLLEKWRNHSNYKGVIKLATWDTGIHKEYLRAEFKGVLNRLQYNLYEIKISNLMKELKRPDYKENLENKRILLSNLIKKQKGL